MNNDDKINLSDGKTVPEYLRLVLSAIKDLKSDLAGLTKKELSLEERLILVEKELAVLETKFNEKVEQVQKRNQNFRWAIGFSVPISIGVFYFIINMLKGS